MKLQQSLPAKRQAPHRSFLFFIAFAAAMGAAEPVQAQKADGSPGQYMGTGSCSSSNCHGSVAPIKNASVLQNEYVTWQRQDSHAKAWSVLGNEDSAKIAKHLGLGDATKEPLCLKCHSTYVPEVASRGQKFQLEDGVTCETCHGPAGGWLNSHTAKGTAHSANVERGMTELVKLDKRASLCLSCHFGSEDKSVDHRLIGAGHPRLSFELDTFESIMPRHWEIDKDYIDRKGSYHAADSWLQTQAAQARASIDRMLSKKRNSNGVYPEFTMFNCYSCHHSLKEDQWKSREYGDHVGEPTLNLASLVVLREALKVLKPALGAQVETQLAGIHEEFKSGRAANTLAALKKAASDPAVVDAKLGPNERNKLFKQLATFGATSAHLSYETAEQVAMGLSSLVADDPTRAGAIENEVKALYNSLKDEEAFTPDAFTAAAKRLAGR